MNSLLQQLYMIPSFRNDILSVEDPNKSLNPEENMLFQTQCLFAALNESVKQSYNPKVFCKSFKGWEGKSINVYEQMDVDEFCSLFLDRVETATKGTLYDKTVKRHFGGVFANQLLGKECPHKSEREEPFISLNLEVKNKRSLQQCLESFVEGEMLQGENAYHCPQCDKKVATLKRVCIKRLPRYMICVLKRFGLNYDTMRKFKLNDYCEFPMRINMEPYTEEGVAKKDREKEKEKAKKEGRDLEETAQSTTATGKYPPAYYEYKLTGVVIHLGSGDAGHYYSLIMDREKTWMPEKERWYEFNDSLVEHYDPENIKDEAFGGEEKVSTAEGTMKTIGKPRNAYLLVYERTTPYDPPEDEDEEEKARKAKLGKVLAATEAIHNAVMAENVKYWQNKFMFHDDYLQFARNMCLTWNSAENVLSAYPSKNCDYKLFNFKEDFIARHSMQTEMGILAVPANERKEMKDVSKEQLRELDLLVYKYAASLLLTTLIRAKDRSLVPDLVDICKAYQNKHLEAAQWLIWQFTNPKVISEFFFECSESEPRSDVVGVLYCAMLKLYEQERVEIGKAESVSKCGLVNFAHLLLRQLPACKKCSGDIGQFYQLLSRMAFLGPEMREYFLKTGVLRRLLGFWASLAVAQWDDLTSIPGTENENPELGLPSVVDERFTSYWEEILAKRQEKNKLEVPLNYTFLIETISLLLRGTTSDENVAASPLALPGCLKGIGVDSVLGNVLTDPKLLSKLIADCGINVAITTMAQALVHISWENLELKLAISKGILQAIGESEWSDLQRYFFILQTMMKAADSTQQKFNDTVTKELFTVMEAGSKAFYATCYATRYLISLARNNSLVEEWMQKNIKSWLWLYSWHEANPYPSCVLTDVRPFKAKDSPGNANTQPEMSAEDQSSWRGMAEKYKKGLISVKTGIQGVVIVGDTAQLADDIGEFETMYYAKFLKDQVVELWYRTQRQRLCSDPRTQNWGRTVVKRVLDERIYLLPEGLPDKFAEWAPVHANNLAKEETHVSKPRPQSPLKDSSDDDEPL